MRPHELAKEMMELKRSKNTVPDFKYTVEVTHGDGSHFLFHNAFVERKKVMMTDMLMVYTEHCGYWPFYMEDLEHWRKYKIV